MPYQEPSEQRNRNMAESYRHGAAIEDIAQFYDLFPATVVGIIRRVDPDLIPRKTGSGPKPERNAEIRRLRSEGQTYVALGERFGISRERVRQIVMGGGA